MFNSRVEGVALFPFHQPQDSDKFKIIVQQTLPQFDKVIRSYLMFNIIFWGLILLQAFLLILLLPFLLKSALMALALAFFILTLFAYLVIREYLASQKTVQLENLKERFLQACRGAMQNGGSSYTLSGACTLLAEELHGREYTYFTAPQFLNKLSPYFEKLSCKMHWEDIFRMQEVLLQQAVMEKIQKVKREPTGLEAHSELARAYIMLSGLYVDPKKVRERDELRWIHPKRISSAMESKFKDASQKAIEEFKIIKEYAPEDPWVHEQLAYSYHDLGLPLEEISEYENILLLKPQHVDTLRKLGELYFKQGQNGKGLKIYEQLRRLNPEQAEEVVASYGA